MYPYSIKNNNYYKKKKYSSIYTPEYVSTFLHSILSSVIKPKNVLDVCIGEGSLSKPWKKDSYIIGIDIEEKGKKYCNEFLHCKFEDILEWKGIIPDLILCNPPFNGSKKLYSFLFLQKMNQLFGTKVPIVLFVPMGFRLNQKLSSERWKYLTTNNEISSIISLPFDCFYQVKIHSEIIIFNCKKLKAHYFVSK